MNYANEFLSGLSGSLLENAKKGQIFYAELGARASRRVLTADPIILGKEYNIGLDAPRLVGRCAVVGFTNEVRWHADGYPTGIAWANVENPAELPWYLGFRANPDQVHEAAEFVGYPPGIVVPHPAQFMAADRVAAAA